VADEVWSQTLWIAPEKNFVNVLNDALSEFAKPTITFRHVPFLKRELLGLSSKVHDEVKPIRTIGRSRDFQ
jgi:hypothetical protein